MAPPPVHGGDGGGGPNSPNPQMIQQFLSSVLSQRGSTAVPYTEDVKWLIRQHLVSLVDAFPSLQPKTATFTHNDGRTVNLLQVEGTVPMIFQDVTYNIPVIIWLMETYPRHPPFVYVNPTRDMVIKRPHPYVNPSGLVTIPYLQNWIYPSSNLVDLGRNLSHAFSRDPPLYSQQRRSNPNPNPHLVANFGLIPNGVLNSSDSMSTAVRPVNPPRVFSPASPYSAGTGLRILQPSPSPPQLQRIEDPTEVYRRNAINKLVEMAHGDILSLRKTTEEEMDGLFNAQAVLRQREEHISKGLREMMNEKESLEQQLQMMLMNTDISEAWLKENESKVQNLGNLDVDNAFEPCDPLSKQMLDCTASDLAIEDVIYSLDKAVQEGSIPFDQYLRNVRLLSREQFFHRAMSTKIRAAQLQTDVAKMAARISNYIS